MLETAEINKSFKLIKERKIISALKKQKFEEKKTNSIFAFFKWIIDQLFDYFGRKNVFVRIFASEVMVDDEDVDDLNMWNLFNLAKDSDE